MIVKFDSLNRLEVPSFYLCNPGSQYRNGVISNVLGALTDLSDRELVLNFNATSELNFRVNLAHRADPEDDAYVTMLYNGVLNRRMIFVENIGYFSITDVQDGYDGGYHYKDVTAMSAEVEIENKLLPYIKDGTYQFSQLFETIVKTIPMWTIGEVNLDVSKKYRTFEDVPTDKNALAFMLEDMQDAYECIFLFDCVKRQINVYDQNNYVMETQIHITKDDVINSLVISENSDNLYTALNVQGDENLNISPVNPLGANIIYNFDYYVSWMTPGLQAKMRDWNALVASKEKEYHDINLNYYNKLTEQSGFKAEIDRLKIQIDMYKRCKDNIVAEGSTATVESYNKVIEQNGGTPVGVQPEISDTLAEIDKLIAAANESMAATQAKLNTVTAEMEKLKESMVAIQNAIGLKTYFTKDEYDELSNYIYEGDYKDEYIAVNDLMTYADKFKQMETLYKRAKDQLKKAAFPTQEFSVDAENFLFAKAFEQWSEQLETGCLINVEVREGDIAALFLSNITVNYDDRNLRMTFGNRFNRFDQKSLFNGVLGDIKKSANSVNYIKDILYPIKDGKFDEMQEAIESSTMLTKENAMSSKDQEILIDDTGILGRKLVSPGRYDPKQIKITNQTIVFTDDEWSTAKTALGYFLFNNPKTGEIEERYGVVADTLIGSMVLSEEVGIYNTNNSITLDNNGFVLTSDYTTQSPSAHVFTIQKKLLGEDGLPYYDKQLYIDDNGNVVLNGTIKIQTAPGSGTTMGDLSSKVEATGSELTNLDSKIKNTTDNLNNRITEESENLSSRLNDTIKGTISSLDGKIGALSSTIDANYIEVQKSITDQLNAYKAEVGQYMTYDGNGLTLGSTTSSFKTLIDNKGMYFKQGDTIVSYVNNHQLHIPNAVIENTMILGKFFFSPRADGGCSLVWQD